VWTSIPPDFERVHITRLTALRKTKFCNRIAQAVIGNNMLTTWALFLFAATLLAWPQESQATQWQELTRAMGKMHAAMASLTPSGNSDVDFVRIMLPHHQAAVDMAKAELVNGTDAQMRRLAQEIITDQQSEIELMQLWLKEHSPKMQKENR
jgi:hypothetical protein